jgi:hypothetical protein
MLVVTGVNMYLRRGALSSMNEDIQSTIEQRKMTAIVRT